MSGTPVADAAAAAGRGALIVVPTDTVYGIGTRPDDPEATRLLFAAKERPDDLALPVLVSDVPEARRLAVFDERAERLAAAWWPGPLTLILRRTEMSIGWALGGDQATIGLRVSAHPLTLAVLSLTGPLAVTSANRSGEPPARTCDELVAAFGDLVSVYLCQDEPLEGVGSTVLDLAQDPPRVLREGDADPQELLRALA